MLSVISSQSAPVLQSACSGCAGAFPVAEADGRVLRHEPVSAEYRLIELAVSGAPLTAEPGQFFNLQCPTSPGEEPFLRRPMSIYGVDRAAGTISFLYKVAGMGTRAISRLPVGGTLPVLGPLGQPFELKDGWGHMVLLARGVGLATLASLCEAARERGIAVTAVLSARHRGALIARERFEAAGARVLEVLDEDGSSEPDRVRALLPSSS
ncbi:MAG: dihydroorotate dehydrogenase electron transfer subunit, partial [Rubrivivax sp.]